MLTRHNFITVKMYAEDERKTQANEIPGHGILFPAMAPSEEI